MTIEKGVDILDKKYGSSAVGAKGSNPAFNQTNPIGMFLKSTASAMGPELIGLDPLKGVPEFRRKNPGFGMVSQFIGPAGPYIGVMKAGKLPKVAGMLDKIGDEATVLGNAKRNAALFGAGVEAPRIAGAAALGGDISDTAESAAFNTMLELGFGGLGGYFRASGKAKKINAKLGASVNLNQPPQLVAQEINDALASGKIAGEEAPYARNLLTQLEDTIRHETILGEKDSKYVKEILGGDAQPLNRLFKYTGLPDKSPVTRRLLTEGQFDTPQELAEVIKTSGLEGNFAYIQFPRYVSGKDANGARALEASFKQGGLQSVGENTLLGREKDGLYVVARKVKGEVGTVAPEDAWVMFKTTDPNRFSKNNAQWGKVINERNAWMIDPKHVPDPNNPLDIYDEAARLTDALPIRGYYQAVKGTGAKALGNINKMLGIDGESEAMRRIRSVFRENFAPAQYEFKNSPRAQWTFMQAKTMFQKAESLAHAMTFGDEALTKGVNLYAKLAANAQLSGRFGSNKAFAKIIEPLDAEQVDELVKATDLGLEGKALEEALASNEISKAVYDALKDIHILDDYMIAQTKGTQRAVGNKEFTPIKGHYLLPRTWKGTWRVPLHNENGRLVYMASGENRAKALAQAEEILKSPETKGWKALAPHESEAADDVELALRVAVGSPEYSTAAALRHEITKKAVQPKSFKVRTGVGGYESQFTKDELTSKFYSNLLERNRYLARLSVDDLLGEQLVKIGTEDLDMMKALSRRIDAMQGRQGPVSKMISQEVDKVFSASLGKNSASKIARTVNEVNHHLTLGMGNLAFPTMNMLTFIQTVLPRVAFTLRASDESLHSSYTWLPLVGSDGKTKGTLGIMEPMKIMWQSFKEMGNPGEGLSSHFGKALREGVVDPKFIEEWAGQNASQVLKLKGVLKGEEPFSNFIRSISNFAPSISEKLSRGNAFTVGHIVGRDVLKLQDDALYRFAKEFTEKTMYNYGAADRPRVFTGPLGTIFGQFKNWSAHYIANMLEYTSEGFNHGNWSPFMWQMGGTTALGGVSATALYPVAETFNDWLSDKSLMENLYERMGGGSGDSAFGNTADGVFYGLPMFMGVSLSGQASDPLSDPSRTASMMFSFVQMQRAQALSKAAGQLIDNYAATGEHPINSEATRDLFIQALAPKTMQRFAAITEDQAVKSLNTGNKLYSGLNAAERVMYMAGFMPKRIALQKDVNEELWKNQEGYNNKIATYGRIWAEAQLAQDWNMITELQQRAIQEGVPLDSIIRSANTRIKKKQDPQAARQFKEGADLNFKSLKIID